MGAGPSLLPARGVCWVLPCCSAPWQDHGDQTQLLLCQPGLQHGTCARRACASSSSRLVCRRLGAARCSARGGNGDVGENCSVSSSVTHPSCLNLCTSSGNSVRYTLAVRCISLRAMAGFLWELIQVGSGHRGKSV